MKTMLIYGLLFTVMIQVSGQNNQDQPEFQLDLCKTGTQQSPIDIVSQKNTKPVCQDIRFSFEESPQQGTIQGGESNKNFTIELLGENGIVQKYKSLQYHSHSQTEHTFDGKQSFLELHHVTKLQDSQGNQLAVFSVFFEVVPTDDQESSFLTKLLDKVRAQITFYKRAFFTEIFEHVLQYGSKIYSYNGSLTTSPCDETVSWYIFEEPIKISQNSLEDFKKLAFDGEIIPEEGNWRPTQPLNGRNVTYAKLCEPSEPNENHSSIQQQWILITILLFCMLL